MTEGWNPTDPLPGVTDGGPWRGPSTTEWIERIRSKSMNDRGAPMPIQVERRSTTHDADVHPFIQRER